MSLELLVAEILTENADSGFSNIDSDSSENFVCHFHDCGRKFTSKRNLVDHYKGHHQGKKPHACPFEGCGKSFLRPAHLTIHIRIHTGEKPFVCPFDGCKKKWNQKSALKQHVRSHTGEKPFKCTFPGCNKKFSTSSSCKRHLSTHDRHQLINKHRMSSRMQEPHSPTSSSSDEEAVSFQSSEIFTPITEIADLPKMNMNFLLN